MKLPSIFLAALLFSLNAGGAHALETLIKGAPASITPLKTPKAQPVMPESDPYTVRGVRVDQTGANPVKARELAIKAVPKLAFQKLVAENLTPEAAASFKYPDDKTIAALVQDFEVKGEQLSSTRYVANYTVRFSPAIAHYVTVKPVTANVTTTTTTTTTVVDNPVRNEPAESVTETVSTTTTVSGEAQAVEAVVPVLPKRHILVLPYYEDISGRTLLWEDGNSWRELWQTAAPRMAGNVELIVPVGDLNDVAAGDTNDVWSGNYRAIEKLANTYKVNEVLLPVANKSGPYMTVDMYFFKDGNLAGREVLQPYVSAQSEVDALKTGLQSVIEALQKATPAKQDNVAQISQGLSGASAVTTTTETVMTSAHAAEQPTDIDVSMRLSSMADWTQLQRRMATVVPPVVMDIKSISRETVKFTLRSSQGISSLQTTLQQKGVLLETPAVMVDTAQLGASPTRQLYTAQLLKQ